MPSENRVDTKSYAYECQYPLRQKIKRVLSGTKAMREAGKTYLPQHQYESDARYQYRLQTSTIVNLAELTLNDWVGRPFAKPVKLSDESPKELIEIEDNMDLQGTDMGTFLRRTFRTGVSQGLAHVFIEFPRIDDSETRTLEDDLRENPRPYWIHTDPDQVLFAYAELLDGRETLTHLRIFEQNMVLDGFAEICINNIRVYDLLHNPGGDNQVQLTIYQEDMEKAEESDDRWFISQPSIFINFPIIPFFTFYADRTDFMMSNIPLEDLVDLNIEHWQVRSEVKRNTLVANFPILAHKNGSLQRQDDDPVQIGPMKILNSGQGEFYYLEHSGAAIKSGMDYLADLERLMSLYGAEFLLARPGEASAPKTATQSVIEFTATISPLQDLALRFKDWVETLLDATAFWFGLGNEQGVGGTILMTTDFTDVDVDRGMEWVATARRNRDLSRQQYLAVLQRRGILGEDFDFEVNDEELNQEPLFGGFTTDDIRLVLGDERRDELRTKGELESGRGNASS